MHGVKFIGFVAGAVWSYMHAYGGAELEKWISFSWYAVLGW
jgi:hypothetical protein